MPMSLQPELVALVLLAALCHALWNALVKSSGDRGATMTFVLLPAAAISLVAAPFWPAPDPASWGFLVAGMVLHNLYYAFLLIAYRVGDLSQVYPLARGAAPLLVGLGAFLFAGEQLSVPAIAGVVLASIGIASLTFERGLMRRPEAAPVLAAFVTACLIASYTVVDGLGVRASGQIIAYILWLNVLKPLPILGWQLLRRRETFMAYTRSDWHTGLAGGIVALFAYNLVLFALAYGAMAHVSALRETSVIFAAAIGAFILKEGFGARRILAAGSWPLASPS